MKEMNKKCGLGGRDEVTKMTLEHEYLLCPELKILFLSAVLSKSLEQELK